MDKIRVEQHSVGGVLWVVGWLFTVGFLQLSFWKGVAAIIIWPVYMGYAFSPLLNTVLRAAQN